MKRIAFLVACTLFLFSCTSGWDQESQDLFKQGCMEDARERGMDDAAANSMCSCRLEKAMTKYPQLADAMEHMDSLINDPEIKACK